ncbi:MAG: EpsG family protein [Verrucomicrobiae bacterium]|nr:EpsG family protein [Verrucomicrobiae bacterium]
MAQFNLGAIVLIGVGVVLFMGFRPVSGAFIDMPGYALAYERVQQGGEGAYRDWLFNGFMRLCSPVLPVAGFFFVCTLIYVAPLAFAFWRVHGTWALPVFLACLSAFSFWVYGVNGIRNGMATSVLILAFAFHDKPILMFTLMAAAWGFHGAALLPAGAFLIVRYVRRTEIWLGFWAACVAVSLLGGNVGGLLLSHYNPVAWDARAESYIHSESYGFRTDFVAYSILPVIITLLLAAPTHARLRRLVARVRSGPAMSWMGNRSAMTAKRWGMGRGRQPCPHVASPVGSIALAGFVPIGDGPRRALGAIRSTLNPEQGRGPHGALRPQPSTREQSRALGSRPVPQRRDQAKQSAWSQLPWVRLLRSDPFYARLVNTYLLSNALWVLVIHANQSNRFAYLSWFMMPWILLYPFVPGKVNDRPRTELIAAVLLVHYLFTYFMWAVVYRMRFG